MTRIAVHEYVAAIRPRYFRGSKAAKGHILDEFCQATGWHRKAAIRLLRQSADRPGLPRRGRPRRYGPPVVAALVRLWELSDRLCGKLLVAVLPTLLVALERHGNRDLTPAVREAVLTISPASIDRLLRRVRTKNRQQPQHHSPATTALKQQIPLRTWRAWSGVSPGEVQADLVLHCGDSTEGCYLTTLTTVDVATGWTVLQSIWGMGKQRVGTGMHHTRQRLPFPVRSIHTDNGGEFIHHVLQPWCQREGIAFSRGRSYRKNDQAYVEQKNWLAVRRRIGYDRYSSHAAHAVFQQLYPLLGLEANFFRPIRKLVSKERVGAKVRKRYDSPQTPYQRVLAAGVLTPLGLQALKRQLLALNPVELQAHIDRLLHQLWSLAQRPQAAKRRQLG